MKTNQVLSSEALSLIDLPIEVRHEIYKHLFCHEPSPLSFASVRNATTLAVGSVDEDVTPPIFYTSIFRVNKAISRDALQFAYSANSFTLTSDMTRFCSLGDIALTSMKSVRLYNNGFRPREDSRQMWHTLSHRCPNLEQLVLEPSGYILVQVIPYLKDFLRTGPEEESRPEVLVDLYLLDRHFSFDFPDRDYRQALQALKKRVAPDAWDGFLKPKQVIMNLPKHVKQVHLIADVSPGVVRALDEVLKDDSTLRLVRMTETLFPTAGSQRVGRQTRFCYFWNSTDEY
ncbi:uncharacterized protein A1O9_03483 [Exophiala aquamarina CBS 119918]|uniref:Uncharacterized protein n=1 Tax=Exophiala aquamarina CBS 119918 TaxID=1182545 RepID=A0A072PPV7_9EURO|nr:uncharacterized protein A1O9_03483 [Exophiala aquamarina CBS 119918]KEF61911.1 hypothetical protein A1O9_03483 [Exophiala aquamarina CBS 119918]